MKNNNYEENYLATLLNLLTQKNANILGKKQNIFANFIPDIDPIVNILINFNQNNFSTMRQNVRLFSLSLMLMTVFSMFVSSTFAQDGKEWYVSISNGSNRNDGSKSSPLKNIQKAINLAQKGDIIRVAEGNYLGLMKIGYIDFKGKPVSIMGGYSTDFSERDPIKHQTTIQPRPEQNGTSGNRSLFALGFKDGDVVIDGVIFDRGWQTAYSIHKDPAQRGQPEGVESGRYMPPPSAGGNHGKEKMVSVLRPIIAGSIERGNLTITNCIFLNASQFGIQMGIRNTKVKIENNLFINSRMAAVEIYGTSASHLPIESEVEFAHNTVLFAWSRTKSFEDMGYGFRCMTGVHYNIHDNIIGGSCFSGIDKTRIGKREASRKVNLDNNLFFLNKQADLTLPSSGGMFMRLRTDMFEDVESLTSAGGNINLDAGTAPSLVKAIDKAYLEGFMNATYSESMKHDPNSEVNTFRQAAGMNQVATVNNSVSMYHNYYPLEKALILIGAMEGKGMQKIK